MKRSIQEIVELVVFGLVALLIGTGLLWVGGWALDGLGWLLKFIASLLWMLLKYIVPVVIAAGLVYWLVRFMMSRRGTGEAVTSAGDTPPGSPAAAAAEPEAAYGSPAVEPTSSPGAEAPAGTMPVSDSWHEPATEPADNFEIPADVGAPVDPVQPADPMPPAEPDVQPATGPATLPVTPEPVDPAVRDHPTPEDSGSDSDGSDRADEDSPLRNG